MNLQALLVSSDDSAADVLGRVLSGFGIATDRSSDPETTLARIHQQKFDALVVDFDDRKVAEKVLLQAKKLGTGPLSVALVAICIIIGIGVPVGAIAGYCGGRMDAVLMRLVDSADVLIGGQGTDVARGHRGIDYCEAEFEHHCDP